jgi:hypothetical protein
VLFEVTDGLKAYASPTATPVRGRPCKIKTCAAGVASDAAVDVALVPVDEAEPLSPKQPETEPPSSNTKIHR